MLMPQLLEAPRPTVVVNLEPLPHGNARIVSTEWQFGALSLNGTTEENMAGVAASCEHQYTVKSGDTLLSIKNREGWTDDTQTLADNTQYVHDYSQPVNGHRNPNAINPGDVVSGTCPQSPRYNMSLPADAGDGLLVIGGVLGILALLAFAKKTPTTR